VAPARAETRLAAAARYDVDAGQLFRQQYGRAQRCQHDAVGQPDLRCCGREGAMQDGRFKVGLAAALAMPKAAGIGIIFEIAAESNMFPDANGVEAGLVGHPGNFDGPCRVVSVADIERNFEHIGSPAIFCRMTWSREPE
jgi:hypothetical protein